MMNRMLSALFLIAMLQAGQAHAQVTVTVNTAQQGITIDGFGGFGSMMPWWFNGPFYTDEFLDLLLDTLGLTILRTEPYPLPDQEAMYTKQLPYLRAIKQAADAKGIDFKLLGSIWTPPARMKDNNHTTGGHLKPSEYANYGKYLVDYMRKFKQDVGYDFYALSPQNEPAIGTGYNSATYYPGEYADMFKAVAREFKSAGHEIQLSYADNIVWGGNGWLGEVFDKMASDRVADSMGSILSCHYAEHDVAKNVEYFAPIANWAKQRTTRLGGNQRTMVWNTEFNGMYSSWDERWESTRDGGAWAFSTQIFQALQYDFTAVIIWALVDPLEGRKEEDNKYSLFYSRNSTEMVLGPLFRLAQTIFRTVRPGSVKVQALSSSNSDVWVVAYQHPQVQTTTVLMLNRAGSATTVNLSGAGLPQTMTMYQTSPTQNFQNMGSVSSTQAITLPVKSLTALTTVPYSVASTAIKPTASTAAKPAALVRPAGLYTLQGRSLTPYNTHRNRTHGATVLVQTYSHGSKGSRLITRQ